MLFMLGLVGLGVFILVAALACLAGKLASKNFQDQEREMIVQEEEEDYDNIDSEGAIFVIEEGAVFDSPGINSNTHEQRLARTKGVSKLVRYGETWGKAFQELKHFY